MVRFRGAKMKKTVLLSSMLLFPFFANATGSGVDFELKSTPVPDALSVFYTQILKRPFRLSPDVVAMTNKNVSFHLMPEQDARKFFIDYMADIGVQSKTKNGVDFYYVPSQSAEKTVLPKFSYTYRPLYRSVDYLASQMQSLASDGGQFSGGGEKTAADMLVFYGTKSEIRRVSEALPLVDIPADEVLVSGYVYEVQSTSKTGSGLQLAVNLLNSKLNLQIGGSSARGYDNFLKLGTGSLSALVELFNTDSRFTTVSAPTLRARSGSQAEFSVGSSTPTLGTVSYQGQSAVQSVNYKDSGIIFKILPEVRFSVIDLNLSQELSNFTTTDNGVNESPTLIKRAISTDISLKDGDIILIGGLADNKNTDTKTGFSLFPFLTSKGGDSTKTDIVIVLQVRKIR